jgi:DNA repair protein SbcC/Rad50
MRPVTLDLHGFASFREQAHVDFTDADFFALIGPTGSGKSTVIDAMTFALYGSVPRWGRKGMVSLALAPSVARGTVKLVFDVAGTRYVVARELRRLSTPGNQRSGTQVNQRAASLERLADPNGLAAPGDPTQPLAKDLAGVNEAVERLLGLSYEDFIQCVVLPQGQFADFLQAKPGERQEILLRLLGAEHYKQMMVKANQRSAAAGQRADTIAETLRGYADATPGAAAAAQAAADALAGLGERVALALPRIAESQSELAAAEERQRRLRAEHTALTALRVPDDVATLDADLAASRQALESLRSAERTAEAADTAARAELASGPRRAPLELAREHRAERARHTAARPGLEAALAEISGQATVAAAAAAKAGADLEEVRTRRDEAGRAAEAARAQVDQLTAERSRLAALRVPGGVAQLDQRLADAAGAASDAAAALETAERAAAAAQADREAAAPAASLNQAARDLADLRAVRDGLAAADAAAARARAARDAADADLAAAEERLRQRRAELDQARRSNVAVGLRPHLVAGEPCPVCEQVVATLPAAVPAPAADAAQAHLDEAEQLLRQAGTAARGAGQAAARADADAAAAAGRLPSLARSLRAALAGPLAGTLLPALAEVAAALEVPGANPGAFPPGLDEALLDRAATEVDGLARARDERDRAGERTAAAAHAARQRQRGAQEQAREAQAELAAARGALRTARDPLVALGAPAVDDTGLADGWASLARWSADQAQARTAALTGAGPAAEQAEGRYRELAGEFGAQDQRLIAQRAAASAAQAAEQRARTQLDQVRGRVAELDELLGDAPDDAEITTQLDRLTRLEAAAGGAQRTLGQARAARANGENAQAALDRSEAAARGQLAAARDQVVALGAPALDGRGLLDGWTELTHWASGQARVRAAGIEEGEAAAGAARAGQAKLAGELSTDLAAAGISLLPETAAARAAAEVAAASERARSAISRIEERQAEAAALAQRQAAAASAQQVAGLLGDLLRANQFQRWLVTEALDDLVAEASATLATLSGGQFDLTYDDGDFQVVDHADADSRRSVRTLSGGETFQASLALALALSTQISALASAGAARLDSIFLDEGFGTLDPETLEVVAATLEALAEGDRMVGVVTHVAALAERVPVRFRVARNAQTSTVTREGLTTGEPES